MKLINGGVATVILSTTNVCVYTYITFCYLLSHSDLDCYYNSKHHRSTNIN